MAVADARTRPRVTWIDALLAAAVTVAEVVGTTVYLHTAPGGRQLDVPGYALLVANALPLVVRNRFPRAVLVASATTAAAYLALGYESGFFILSFVFAVWAAVSAGWRLFTAAVVATFLGGFALIGQLTDGGHANNGEALFWTTGWIVASFVLGEVSRSRRQYLEQVEQRAIDAERTREEEARRRAGEERIRIARELHDVLAHHISLINVQSGVALHLIDRQPDQARGALLAINDASKEALRELRATLGVLRQVDEAEPRSPAPGLGRLDELVERARAAGLVVDVETSGEARPLPPATDLAAYRIVQESLTNVARHARASRVSIAIRHDPGEVALAIEDDGAGVAGGDLRPGNGLTGMRERAAAAGGELEAGPGPAGGFVVRVRLPVPATS